MERVFAQHLARTGDATYAAAKAGFGSPAKRGQEKKSDPAIQAESRKIARAMLHDVGALVGVETLIEIARDAKQPAGARVQAGDKLIRHSGLSAVDRDEKDPGEMDGEELQRALDKLRNELANRAKPVLEHESIAAAEPSILD